MSLGESLLEPSAFLNILDRRLPSISRGYGMLVTHTEEGKAIERGTVTFARLGDQHLLLTAAHVADKHVGRTSTLVHFELDDQGAPQLEQIQRGRRVTFEPHLLIRDDNLDIAAFAVPDEVARLPALIWFDLKLGARALTSLVSDLPTPTDTAVMALALGFGNYAAIENASQRSQLFGGAPLLCELRSCDPEDERRPQIILEPYVEPDHLRARELATLERQFVDRLSSWDDGLEPKSPAAFGGYSGGPIVYVSLEGEYVLGIVTDGVRRPGAARIFASPVTAILRSIGL